MKRDGVAGSTWTSCRESPRSRRDPGARAVCVLCVSPGERSTPLETPRLRRERVTESRPAPLTNLLRPTSPDTDRELTPHTLFRNVIRNVHRHTTKTIPPPTRPLIHVAAGNLYACEMMRVGTPINYLASAGMLALGSAAHE
jgi:hypothetical protein